MEHQPARQESSLDHNSSEMLELTPNSDFESVFTKEGDGYHRVKLDEPRSEIFWSAAVEYAKSKQMRLIINGCDDYDSKLMMTFNQTKHSNLTKIMKLVDNVDWIGTCLPDNSTIDEADSIMAGVKRLKEVRHVHIININFSNVAQLKQRLTAWVQTRVDVNSEGSGGWPWKAGDGELLLDIKSPKLSRSKRGHRSRSEEDDVINHVRSLKSKRCTCGLKFPGDQQYRYI